jgi:hypothetical protein
MELERRPISVLVPVVPVRISEFAIRTLIPTEEEVRSATLSPIPSFWVLSVGHVENRKKTPKTKLTLKASASFQDLLLKIFVLHI